MNSQPNFDIKADIHSKLARFAIDSTGFPSVMEPSEDGEWCHAEDIEDAHNNKNHGAAHYTFDVTGFPGHMVAEEQGEWCHV